MAALSIVVVALFGSVVANEVSYRVPTSFDSGDESLSPAVADQEAELAQAMEADPVLAARVYANAAAVARDAAGPASVEAEGEDAEQRRDGLLRQWSSFLLDNIHMARRQNEAVEAADALARAQARREAGVPDEPRSKFSPAEREAKKAKKAAATQKKLAKQRARVLKEEEASQKRLRVRRQGMLQLPRRWSYSSSVASFLAAGAGARAGAATGARSSMASDAEVAAVSTPSPPGGEVAPVLTEGDRAPAGIMGVGKGEFAMTEGAEPSTGFFRQTPECDAAMRVWFEICAFASPEGKDSLYWHGKNDGYFPPAKNGEGNKASSVDVLSTANYIGNIIANEASERELGENSWGRQRERAAAKPGAGGAAAGGAAAGGGGGGGVGGLLKKVGG